MTPHSDDIPETVTSAIANAKKVFLICILIALLLCIYVIFFSDGLIFKLNGHGRFALALAAIFSALGTFFFMGISFFSARSGFDDQPNYRELVEQHRNKTQTK